jgi:hypothetical protein
MIKTDAATPYQRPPYVYGEILSRSIDTPGPSARLPFGRLVSQGIAVSVVLTFLIVLTYILLHPRNGYNFFFIYLLPFYLAVAVVFGALEGLIIWGCSRLARRQLQPGARTTIAVVVLGVLIGVYWWNIPPSPYGYKSSTTDFFGVLTVSLIIGGLFGGLIGSRLQPWRALVRGINSVPAWSRVLTGITGFFLRVIVVWLLMESILILACNLQNFHQRDVVMTALMLGHLVAAVVIVFARLRFWLLLPLALLINFPTVVFLTDVLPPDELILQGIVVSYLGVWAAFLITRCSLTYSALSVLKEELDYYLFD